MAARFRCFVVLVGFGFLFLAGCAVYREGAGAAPAARDDLLPAGPEGARLLVRRAWIELEAGDIDAAARGAEGIAQARGGYVEGSRVSGGEARLALRVPAADLERVLTELAALGEETGRGIVAEDVTERAIDIEARLENYRAARDRLRALLERASTVDEVVAVEERLARLQAEIDSLEGRLRHLRASVSLAAVEVTVRRGRILGPLGWVFYGAWWGVSKLFVLRG